MSSVEWQPIETVPTDGTRVLVWNNLIRMAEPLREKNGVTYHAGFLDVPTALRQPIKAFECNTHWMPLPPPPIVHGE